MNETKIIEYVTEYNTYDIEAGYDLTVDMNDGADADGNRGMKRLWIDDINIISVKNQNTDNEILDMIPDPTLRILENWFAENL